MKKIERGSAGKTCKLKPHIKDRPPLNVETAGELESMFKILGNRTRLRILHTIVRSGNICVTDIANEIEMKPQAVSNQLQRLVDRGIVSARRNGNNIHYSIVDPCVIGLLNQGLCLLEDSETRRPSR